MIEVAELKRNRLFRTLDEAQLQFIAQQMIRRVYAPGQFIFVEGEDAVGLWFILRGKVKILKHSRSGRLQGLCVVNTGKCFGGCPLFDTETNPADAQALSEVTLAVLPRHSLRQIIQHDAQITLTLMQLYNQRTQLLARLGESLGAWPVSLRVNDCLIAHAGQEDSDLVVRLTHEEISTLVGTAREVVSRHLSLLESQAIIQTSPGKITIQDVVALETPCLGNYASSA